jgi:hypothetical protein
MAATRRTATPAQRDPEIPHLRSLDRTVAGGRRATRESVKASAGLAAVVAALLVLTAACSSSNPIASSSGSSSGRLAKVASKVAADKAIPTWTAPGPPVDVSKLRGSGSLSFR